MARTVRCGLIQVSLAGVGEDILELKEAMVRKHEEMIGEAVARGVRMLCLQELFYAPYFPAEQDTKWYALAEPIPGPTTQRMQNLACKYGVVLVVPIMEEALVGVYYNTAVVIDADGTLLGLYRKNHLPHLPGFWEKFYFKPGNLGYPVFDTAYARIGVYICYDRHFPEGARILGLRGAEILFNPSATVEGLSRYLWELEQPAHAVANGYFVGVINRVGVEEPWRTGRYYGGSYFCDPRGQILVRGSEDQDEVVIADLDLDLIREVRTLWQFYRDRRPETYGELVEPLP